MICHRWFALVVLLVLAGQRAFAATPSSLALADLKEGDLLFEQSVSAQSTYIQQATGSPWSHVAVALRPQPDVPMEAYEAAGPVGFTSLKKLLQRSRDGRLTVMRLKAGELPPDRLEKLRAQLLKQRGKPYDDLFLWDDSTLYCSELLWKAFQTGCGLEVGKTCPWSDLHLDSSAALATLKKRYADHHVPFDLDQLKQQPVITPAAMLASPLLKEIGVLQASPLPAATPL